MKQDTPEAKKLTALLKRLKSEYEIESPPQRDPVLEMIYSFLLWEATQAEADDALARLLAAVVDVNELRVSLEAEIVEMIGPTYPLVHERVARLREAMYEVYVREYSMEMRSIASASKKDQRAYLDTLPGMTPYVAARVMLLSFGGHAMPVDRKLVVMLGDETVLEHDTSPDHAESWLQRHIKADEAIDAHLLFQAWADDHDVPDDVFAPAVSIEQAAEEAHTNTSPKKGGPRGKTSGKRAKKK
ncbi:MAG: hypothetical protein WD534_16670 [Phycisphaeraceae bacterium]